MGHNGQGGHLLAAPLLSLLSRAAFFLLTEKIISSSPASKNLVLELKRSLFFLREEVREQHILEEDCPGTSAAELWPA